MPSYDPTPRVPDASADRRRAPRLELASPLVGQDESGENVALVNVSASGVLVHSTRLAAPGEVRHLRFPITVDGMLVRFSARVVHVTHTSGADGTSYAIGLHFTSPLSDETRQVLRLLAGLPV